MASEPALILAFDTSAAHCAAALLRGSRVIARRVEPMARGQAERLLPMLEQVLAAAGVVWADLTAVAVCTGPGNFTGTRIGVAAARGLSLALGRPAIGVTLFEALAEGRPGHVLALADNRREGISAQLMCDGSPVAAPVGSLAELGAVPPGTLCIGFAAGQTAMALGLEPGDGEARPDPAAIARCALARSGRQLPPPAPLYLRPADAAPSREPAPLLLDDA